MNPLITLAQAKSWLNIQSDQTSDDSLITGIIAGASDNFGLLTGRDQLAPTTYTERLNGSGTAELIPSNLPLISISVLQIDGRTMPVSSTFGVPGYFFDENRIQLVGGGVSFPWAPSGIPFNFPRGRGNVSLNYIAGFANAKVTGEIVKVPSASPYQATLAQASLYAGALVLSYADSGTALTQVAANPAAGQYVLSTNGSLLLTFNAADAAASLLANYEILNIPMAVQQCVWEMVGWAYKNRDRIGISTQSFTQAALNNTYSQAPFSPGSLQTIKNFRRKLARWQ